MRVLVIDDDEEILDIVSAFLHGAGHEVQATTSAKRAMDWLESGRFDALVTDVLLPEIDGVEIMRLVRKKYPDMWTVAISGGTSRFPASSALRLTELFGADRALFKPFSEAELLASLEVQRWSAVRVCS